MDDLVHVRLDTLTQERALRAPEAFLARAAALDELEFPILDSLAPGSASRRRALRLRRALRAADAALFAQLRAKLTDPGTPYEDRQQLLRQYAPTDTEDALRYDALDTLVNGVLRLTVDTTPAGLTEPELVAFQPTPARLILELAGREVITPADVCFDLGSGLGHVPILLALLTGAQTVGIELDGALCAAAQRSAAALGLSNVSVIRSDVRAADLRAGTFFYLYTPFTGAVLQRVLAQLQAVAALHPIRVCTYGPYLETLAAQPWLRAAPGSGPLTLFQT